MDIIDLERVTPADYCHDVRDQLKQHVYGRSVAAFRSGEALRETVKDPKSVESDKRRMRERLLTSLGGLPDSGVPLNATTVGSIMCRSFRVEKIIYESRPSVFVTANLYLPKRTDSPVPAIFYMPGHNREAKHSSDYQIVFHYLTSAGFVVFVQDPVGQGERLSYYEQSIGQSTVDWGTVEHDYAGTQCLATGFPIARYFLHDAMRGLDYLCSRSEVDSTRIGVVGTSGGGTMTSLLMMTDPRVAAAAPGSFITSREVYMHTGGAQDAEQIWPGMTECGWEHDDILNLFAPKPALVLAARHDFFPIDGTRETVHRAKRFYELLGVGGNLEFFVDDSAHGMNPSMARQATRFFSRHLLGHDYHPSDEGFSPIVPQELWCTSSGQVRGELEGARFVHEENLDLLTAIECSRRIIPEDQRRTRGLEWLREKVMADRKRCDLTVRRYQAVQANRLTCEFVIWWSQPGMMNHACLARDLAFAGKLLPVTIAVWDGGVTSIGSHSDWLRSETGGGRAVMVLDATGVGAIAPHPLSACPPTDFYGVIHKLNDDLIWLGDSIAALRTYDVLRALDVVDELWDVDTSDTHLYAFGRQGVYARLASALDERVKKTEVVGGMGSYSDFVRDRCYDPHDIRSVVIPGILQHLDLPELTQR